MPRPKVRPRRRGTAARIPGRLADLRGPARGTVVLPTHMTWHGLREFDVSEAGGRLRLYTIVLSQGSRNDIVRFLDPDLLRQDWPQLRGWWRPRSATPAPAGSAWPSGPARRLRGPPP